MKGYDYLSSVEDINPFITFVRYFDDLGSVSIYQIIGQYITATVNCGMIMIQIITSMVMILVDYNNAGHIMSLHKMRETFGLCYRSEIPNLYSVNSMYTFIVIFILSYISLFIRLNQMKSRTIQPRPILIYNAFFNLISPILTTIICIGFSSSLFNYIQHDHKKSLVISILSFLSIPSVLFALIRLITDSRIEKLPYVIPNFNLTVCTFAFYIVSIIGGIYIEYSAHDTPATIFITVFLLIFGVILLYQVFKVPVYLNGWHSFLAIMIVFVIDAVFVTLFYSRFVYVYHVDAVIRVVIATAIFAVLALLHTFVSRWNIRRHLRGIDYVDPRNYTAQRLSRILCVADVRKDQMKFTNDFPARVMQAFPSNFSLIIFSILFKLYDPSAHKEILEFAEKLSVFNTTNYFISSMLRSIIFIVSGTTSPKNMNISSALLSICYKMEAEYWYYIIQNNRKMTLRTFHDLVQLVQRSKPFFEKHNNIIGGNEEFLKYVSIEPRLYKLTSVYGGESFETDDKSESMIINDDLFININEEYFIRRISNIKKENPKYYILLKALTISMLALIVVLSMGTYMFISHTDSPSVSNYKMIHRLFTGYINLIKAWEVPTSLYFMTNATETDYSNGIDQINLALDTIESIPAVAQNTSLVGLIEKARNELIYAVETRSFVNSSNTTHQLFHGITNRGKTIFSIYSEYLNECDNTLKFCIICLCITLVAFSVLFYFTRRVLATFYEYIGSQPMHFNKLISSSLHSTYTRLVPNEVNVTGEQNKIQSTYFLLFCAGFLPFIVCLIYCVDLNYITSKMIRFVRSTLLISQTAPVIANTLIVLPIMANISTKNDSMRNHSVEMARMAYSHLDGIASKLYTNRVPYNYSKVSDLTEYPQMISPSWLTKDDLVGCLDIMNETLYVQYFNGTTILLRDLYILLQEAEHEKSIAHVSNMCIPASLSCAVPTINLLNEITHQLEFLADTVIFTFILAPILFIIALFIMIVYGVMIVNRIDTSVRLMKRIISLPRYENPFFDENHHFLGFKDEIQSVADQVFRAFPVPTFEITKDNKILEQNDTAMQVFGDIKGTLSGRLPTEVIDANGLRHFYNYSRYLKKSLPESLKIKGDMVMISNDMTGLFNKKNTLRNLYKDIRLTFSIPTVLQREKPTHVQGVAIVNFCFAQNITNEAFLNYSSKIEDFFTQFVSFFMFEKMRFSFYVLFYDSNVSRQAARDAISFAQLARYEAINRKMGVKIAVAMEDEVIAKAEKTDMIWSVKFPNSILWRSDMMFSHIDYGRIICLSKMSPGMHFTKTIHIGKFNEAVEVITI